MSAKNAIQSSPARDAIRRAMFQQVTPRQQAHFERLRQPRKPASPAA